MEEEVAEEVLFPLGEEVIASFLKEVSYLEESFLEVEVLSSLVQVPLVFPFPFPFQEGAPYPYLELLPLFQVQLNPLELTRLWVLLILLYP